MTTVNPPQDFEHADTDPELVCQGDAGVVRVGRRRQCDTAPGPWPFRFAIARTDDGHTFAGYLWQIRPAPDRHQHAGGSR
jgi:hypothetical protein